MSRSEKSQQAICMVLRLFSPEARALLVRDKDEIKEEFGEMVTRAALMPTGPELDELALKILMNYFLYTDPDLGPLVEITGVMEMLEKAEK